MGRNDIILQSLVGSSWHGHVRRTCLAINWLTTSWLATSRGEMVPMNCFSAWLHTHHTPWVEHNFMIVKAWVINIKSLYLGAAPRPWTPRACVTPSTRRGTSSTPHFPPPLLLQHHSHLSTPDDVCDISFANCVTSLSKIMAHWKYTRVPIMTNINCLQTVWQCFLE